MGPSANGVILGESGTVQETNMARRPWLRIVTVVLLGMVIGLGGLASSSAQDAAPTSGELSIWHGWTGAEADTLNNDILPAWEAAYPDIKIETLAVPFDQLKNKYQTETATGGGPDLLIGPLDWVGELATAELIAPLDEMATQDGLANYVPSTVEALRDDGKLYGMRESCETVALYSHPPLLESPPAPTAELDAFAATMPAETYALALFSNFYHPAGY